MNKIIIETVGKKMLGDIYTPVSIYLRLRDRYRDTILLESTDHHAAENSYSFICINAIAGMEISTSESIEFKLPGKTAERINVADTKLVPDMLWNFMQNFEVNDTADKTLKFAQGLYGYSSFDAVQFFDKVKVTDKSAYKIPLMRYRLYQYVIAFNHYKDELFLCENKIDGIDSDIAALESLIKNKDVPVYPFKLIGEEQSNMTNEAYLDMVRKGIKSCLRGDVFQIVLSRRFEQKFSGDEFNVYRALRNINPSPYLFFFDYGEYKIFGSSPESQLVIQNQQAVVHPIAGTFKRTGDDKTDRAEAERLLLDAKENAEHVMLVDLARNDLSRICTDVTVQQYRQVQYYSHVIHLVSEVTGKVEAHQNPFELFAKTFPAGTLSGAPKIKALELIDSFEPTNRSYYGGGIGFMGFDGSCNQAIMIRTFLSQQNTLICQAGAGVVALSVPENELQEVKNKLNALKSAAKSAEYIH
jgi:anthranilate synthase component 1